MTSSQPERLKNKLPKQLSGCVNTRPWWAYLASLQGVVLQLGQEKERRLRPGQSQSLGGGQEVCRLCVSGENQGECQEKPEAGLQRQTHGTFPLAKHVPAAPRSCSSHKHAKPATWNSASSRQQLRTTFHSLRNSPARPLPPSHRSDEVTSVTAPSCLHVSPQIQQRSRQARRSFPPQLAHSRETVP